ncbi:JLP1 Alpha-ketoglutarate-dependent sulfonate dioxygenase [Candida maltosa Xu316]|uniref:Alpha-ketoglutarate-dependent sulfonate dioxygenase n=1 Tax=Candida maltosa (strain Xu316) TaxID=1245528 RepID=M3HPU2_CANMX|nr:Alpha-ketoglutarate-dependent sulfonate dioxygenase [Candida maltosa Xu316]
MAQRFGNSDIHFNKDFDEVADDGVLVINSENRKQAKYPDFLPTWDPNFKLPPLKFEKYIDPASRADPSFPNLFPKDAKYSTKRITPKFGTEVDGIQLSQLNDKGRDELALLLAQRKVLLFNDQDFADKGPGFAVEFGKYFGRLHIHPSSGSPRGHPELHITYRRPEKGELERVFAHRTTSVGFHSDVSYEITPSRFTVFQVLESGDGGDTVFVDTVEAYNRLSPAFKERLEGLHVLHTSEDQAANSSFQGGVQRRKPVSNIHPLVRLDPITKEKSLYVNPAFGRRIVELKKEESDNLLQFLHSHIERSVDLQLRVNWEGGNRNKVALFHNSGVSHTATFDTVEGEVRHAFRISVLGERPISDLKDLNKEEYTPGDLADALNAIKPT